MAFDTKDMEDEKAAKLAAEETKAQAEGDLAITVKDLANAEKALETAQNNCMQVAADHEVTIKSRAEELAAIAEAKKILMSTTPGAVEQTYSLLQVSQGATIRSRQDLMNAEIITLLKGLAKKHHSAAPAQLKEEVKELQAELAALAKRQAEMDKVRSK